MQSMPLAVLKLPAQRRETNRPTLHAIHTACGIETKRGNFASVFGENCMQSIPLAVLKHLLPQIERVMIFIACNPYRLRY